VACAESGSLTAAAKQCNLVVPAASRRIRELEDALGEPLFERHSRGLQPTPAGKIFVRHGVTLMQGVGNLFSELADRRAGTTLHIKLCASTAGINQFLPPMLATYAQRFPDIQIDVQEQVSARVIAAIRERQADLGVFVEGPDVDGLEVNDFRRDELVLILPPDHPLARHGHDAGPIAFAQTLDEPWISLPAGAAMLQQQQQAAHAAGRPFKLKMQVRSFDAVGHVVAAGLGIATLPKNAALPLIKALGLGWRALSDAWVHRQLKLAMRPDAEPAVVALRDFLTLSQTANAA